MSPLLVIFAATFGASAAAFVPRLAHRLAVRRGESPRQACAACGRPYGGWVRAGPACACRPGSLLVVPVGAAVAIMLTVALGPSPLLPGYLLAAVPGMLLAVIDMRCLRLPDRLVGALAVLGVGPAVVVHPERVGRALAAGGLVLIAYGVIALLPAEGLGAGDVKLAAVLAVILGFAGWRAVVAGLVVPHLITGPIALALLIRRRTSVIAFGPALLAGALIALTAT